MRYIVRSAAVGALIMSAVLSVGSGAVGAAELIQPNQHFIGLVNGSNTQAVVYTVCAGPIWSGRTGPVVGGQTLAVARVAKRNGFTSVFSSVNAWFVPKASGPPPEQVKFTTYGTEMAIPSTVRVPCGGRGQVEFSSCPYAAPCVFGWVPNLVNVKFVNIAD